MATRYFKPRKDVYAKDILIPQKVVGSETYRYASDGYSRRWVRNQSVYDTNGPLSKNFIEVPTEAEAIEGY